MPEAWNARSGEQMKASHKALYAYCNAVMEPWDGPAAVCATDGRWVVAGKDRNGLRPLRVAYTDDGLLIMGSEAGMCRVEESRIIRKPAHRAGPDDRHRPGGGPALRRGRDHRPTWPASHPYDQWLGNMVDLGETDRARARAAPLQPRGTGPPPGRRRHQPGGPGADPGPHGRGRQGSRRLDGRRRAAGGAVRPATGRSATSSARTSAR